MLNSDKAHIYNLLEYVQRQLFPVKNCLQRQKFSNNTSGKLLDSESPTFMMEVEEKIWQNMMLFKIDVTNDIEGSNDISFDSLLIRVEYRCEQWRSLIKGNYKY